MHNLIPQHFKEVLKCSKIFIDSNVFMDPNYNGFFVVIKNAMKYVNNKIYIISEQYDEIQNIKKRTSHKDPLNKKALLAMIRIENLLKANSLNILNLGVNSEKNAYADPEIILKLKEFSIKESVCLITNDRDLRIRTNALLNKNQRKDFIITDMFELNRDCKKLIELDIQLFYEYHEENNKLYKLTGGK